MDPYFFEFDLQTGEISDDTRPHYAVRYRDTANGIIVNIGDGYRHDLDIEAKHWNRIIKIIKNDELDKSGINAILEGLMGYCLPEEYNETLTNGIKSGKIKEINLTITQDRN